jgi:carbon-monoxide dehydrogenase small subunit
MKNISFILNGEKVEANVEPNMKLLDLLRDVFGYASPKHGCGKGECGACSVLLNGDSVRSCITLAVEVDGKEVVTLEGLQKDGLTDSQKAFIKHNAFQCGFCAPGFIITTEEMLRKNPSPTEEEIKETMANNLCRCTGYKNIIEAVEELVEERKRG